MKRFLSKDNDSEIENGYIEEILLDGSCEEIDCIGYGWTLTEESCKGNCPLHPNVEPVWVPM